MQNKSDLLLSEYQHAILHEMGVSSWQLAENIKPEANSTNTVVKTNVASTGVVDKANALARLKQLKEQTVAPESMDSVLITFSQSDEKLPIFNDVLNALELSDKSQKFMTIDKLGHYADFPLSWTIGNNISLNQNQLITPALPQLMHANAKRQLWQKIQTFLPDKNSKKITVE